MEDEDERQRRDLQRATALLETMPREEMAEMLLDIQSFFTTTLDKSVSFWRILARKNRCRLQITKAFSAQDKSHAIFGRELEQQVDQKEEDASSTASVQRERTNQNRGSEDDDATTHTSDKPSINADFEAMKEKQCRFCLLYFTPDQNVRDLDNGLGPCSYHPGKSHSEDKEPFKKD
ncbi:hypothetical protein DHEL01_v210846 [Diaporthe helianthi]|uniref:Uncharacterized protein n=1 Tax=Diaporthe helianthi TaxID=158607 RepID=A0A2P5HKH3_DIAHE|nr:hypothetical protein DHEL01_v210846 [Diaporthe helianthi]